MVLLLLVCNCLFFSTLQSDSEYMSGQLSAFGYAITEEPEGADLWLINTYGLSVLFGSFLISIFYHWLTGCS